jgi:glycogen debranching enzyme
MGPFVAAHVKTHGYSEAARRQAAEWLAPLQQHLSEAALGHISEIFEGDAPHRPCGCVAQAWSVAEILRAYLEDVKGIRPLGQFETRSSKRPAGVLEPVSR